MKTLQKIALILIATILTITVSCKKEADGINGIEVTNIVTSECVFHADDKATKSYEVPDSLAVRYNNGTLYIEHYNLTLNCGCHHAVVDVTETGDTIRINEWEGEMEVWANCICAVNNSFEIKGVEPGRHTLVIENWYPGAYTQTFEF